MVMLDGAPVSHAMPTALNLARRRTAFSPDAPKPVPIRVSARSMSSNWPQAELLSYYVILSRAGASLTQLPHPD